MKEQVHIVFVSSVSATFELLNDEIYATKEPYGIYLNDVFIRNDNRNVFSVFKLIPNTSYVLKLVLNNESITQEFNTNSETVAIDVKSFGAIGDGIANDTSAIQLAIYCCPKNGRVFLEKGTFLVSSIFLKDDITIEVKKDSILKGIIDRTKIPYLPRTIDLYDGSELLLGTWEGEKNNMFASIILGYQVKNCNVLGEGIIDGDAQNGDWWIKHREPRIAWRPRNIFLNQCRNIVIQGLTSQNSAAWNIHPFFSNNCQFLNLNINSSKDSPNTDGLNPESCDQIDILGINFSVGDDCIAIKSGKIEMGMKYKTPSSNITIRNCFMHDGHGGVVLGSEIGAGVKDLNVSKCYFKCTDRGLRIKTRRGRGKYSVLDGIAFEQIKMEGVLTPLVINSYYNCDPIDGKSEYVWSKDKLPIDDRTPYLGTFHFKDISCTDCEVCAGFFYGLPERPIKEVYLENVSISFKEEAKEGLPAMMCYLDPMRKENLYFNYVDRVYLENVKVSGAAKDTYTLKNVNIVTEEK